MEGGENDITFTLKSPNSFEIFREEKNVFGSHHVQLDLPNNGRGEYSFCFDNSFSYSSKKRVILFILLQGGGTFNDKKMKD